jgi:hypothetical protein
LASPNKDVIFRHNKKIKVMDEKLKLTLEQEKYLCRVNRMNAYDIINELKTLKKGLENAEFFENISTINFHLIQITIVETILKTRCISN